MDAEGHLAARARSFGEDVLVVDLEAQILGVAEGDLSPEAEAREALLAELVGTRDYARKCGFRRVLVGLSGAVDSWLVAVVAVQHLGAENVVGVLMPSRFSSRESREDA
jgi:NAD+ synthase (glutamine-hydrolysing)